MWIILYIFICSTLLLWLPWAKADKFCQPKEIIFVIMSMILLGSVGMMKNTIRCIFHNIWLSLIFIYIGLSFCCHTIFPILFKGMVLGKDNLLYIPIWNLFPSINVLLALLIIYFLIEYTDNQNRWRNVAKLICILSFSIACYALFQKLGFDCWKTNTSGYYRMFTVFGNASLTGAYLGMTIPLFFIFHNIKSYLGIIIIIIACYLTTSLVAIIGAFLGIMAYFILIKNKWVIALCLWILAGATWYAMIKGGFITHFHGRIDIWQEVINRIKIGNPFFGFGLGSFPRDFAILKPYQTPLLENPIRWGSSHNIFFDALYEGGFILIILMLGYLISSIIKIRKVIKNNVFNGFIAAGCSYLVISCGTFPHRIAPLALMGIIYISAIEAFTSQIRRV